MIRAILAVALLLLPSATALDAFPSETHWGAREATFVVRATGALTVRAPPGVIVTNVTTSWHGLPGATQMRATRNNGNAATIEILDAAGTGVELDWPAESAPHRALLPQPSWLVLAACAATALLWRVARGSWKSP